ncbi:MAG: hypothetical protein E7511_04305 [Ruminococcus sp.]|nr:hypothetical protein [Ruminococcus sp.]
MKKRVLALVLPMMLCGCSAEAAVESKSTEPVMHVNIDDTIPYQDVPAFLASDFCKEMRESGYTVYVPEFDAEKYDFVKVESHRSFYNFFFDEKGTSKRINYQITYNTFEKTVEEFTGNVLDTSGDIFTTVEKDGVEYDVYIPKTPYMTETEYNLQYIPFEKYHVYILCKTSTPEEALAYIHDFDLVPVEEGTVATEVSVESDTAS